MREHLTAVMREIYVNKPSTLYLVHRTLSNYVRLQGTKANSLCSDIASCPFPAPPSVRISRQEIIDFLIEGSKFCVDSLTVHSGRPMLL